MYSWNEEKDKSEEEKIDMNKFMEKHYEEFRKLKFVRELKREGAQEFWDELKEYHDLVMAHIGHLLVSHGVSLEDENKFLDKLLEKHNVVK